MEASTQSVTDVAHRLDRLEGALARLYAFAMAVLVVLGAALPLAVQHPGEEDGISVSLLTFIPAFSPEEPPSDGGEAVFNGVAITGFVGLLIVLGLIVLVVMPTVGARHYRGGMRKFGKTLVVLAYIGCTVALILASMVAAGEKHGHYEWGSAVLIIALIGLAPLFSSKQDSLFAAGD